MPDSHLTPRPRALRFAEAGFLSIALVLFAKVFASHALTRRAQHRTDELFVAVSSHIDQIAELNELLATLHADVQRVMSGVSPEAIEGLWSHAQRAEARFTELGERYTAVSSRPDAQSVDLETWHRMRAVSRVYFATIQRLIALLRRDEVDDARVLLHDALEPTRVREAVLAANLLRHHAAHMHALHGAIGQSYRATFQVDLAASIAVLGLLLVVRRAVMERLIAEEKQRATNMKLLAERNRDLDDFAQRIAHDLKGLVNPISGYASLISEDPADRGRVTRYAERIAGKADEVVAMVDELLRLARAGHGSQGPTQPRPVIAAAIEQYEAQILDLGAQVEVVCADDVPLDVGEVPLREVVQNLVQNSLKYRSPERTLSLRVELDGEDDDLATLTVRDNGIGMSPAVASRAHEPFFRAATERDVPGSGLGLAIVHRIATAHGGGLYVESVEGSGTTVRVRLPRWER